VRKKPTSLYLRFSKSRRRQASSSSSSSDLCR
jgi:hypothetical protein